ncbi:MAG: hypothetical protein SGILL_006824 [Bacillariaceae sp.]
MRFFLYASLVAAATSFSMRPATTIHSSTTASSKTTTKTQLFDSTTSYSQEECLAIQKALPSPLIDAQGNVVDDPQQIASLMEGQRVALYFAAGWSRDCRELDFMLAQYRNALRDSEQPIQLIYISSDKSTEEQLARMQELGLELGVPLGEVSDALKKQYGIWSDAEVEKFGGVVRPKVDDGEYVIGDDEGDEVVNEDGQPSLQERIDEIGGMGAAVEAALAPKDAPEEMPDDGSGRRSGIPAFVVLDNKGNEFDFLNTERDSITALADWPLDDLQGHW